MFDHVMSVLMVAIGWWRQGGRMEVEGDVNTYLCAGAHPRSLQDVRY